VDISVQNLCLAIYTKHVKLLFFTGYWRNASQNPLFVFAEPQLKTTDVLFNFCILFRFNTFVCITRTTSY